MPARVAPKVGQVVDHSFLWAAEQAAGRIEGRKVRPCLIIAVESVDNSNRVTLLPITSQPPSPGSTVVAVPGNIKDRLGLDANRPAWVVVDDANVFVWPGFDLVPQVDGGFVRGLVTAGFFQQVRDTVIQARSRGRPRRIDRDY
jgi:hypothetical protein